MNDTVIIKALKRWLEDIRKARQEFFACAGYEDQQTARYEELMVAAIDLIEDYQAEIQELIGDNEKLQLKIEQEGEHPTQNTPCDADVERQKKNIKFETGDYAKIVKKINGHGFKIGTIVRLEKYTDDYLAFVDNVSWWVTDDELSEMVGGHE